MCLVGGSAIRVRIATIAIAITRSMIEPRCPRTRYPFNVHGSFLTIVHVGRIISRQDTRPVRADVI
jgi:hypothetical protein